MDYIKDETGAIKEALETLENVLCMVIGYALTTTGPNVYGPVRISLGRVLKAVREGYDEASNLCALLEQMEVQAGR